VDLLVEQQVCLPHQLAVQGDAADVADVTVRDRRAIDLRLEHLALHQASVVLFGSDYDELLPVGAA